MGKGPSRRAAHCGLLMNVKTCTKCKTEKQLDGFARATKGKFGRCSICKTCTRAYYNREDALARVRKRRSTVQGREDEGRWQREYRRNNPLRRLLLEAKNRARANGLPFEISKADVSLPTMCPVLGIPIVIGGKARNDNAPSLDRIVNERGYIKGNVRVISWRANRLKNDATLDELRNIVAYYESALAVGLTASASNPSRTPPKAPPPPGPRVVVEGVLPT